MARLLPMAAACLVGLALGRALPREAGRPEAPPPTAAPAPPPPATDTCRSTLASVKAQLSLCLAVRSAAQPAAPGPASSENVALRMPGETRAEEARRLVDETDEAVVVRRPDGTLRIYRADEWPPPGGAGDAQVIAHKLPDGGIAWEGPR